jgi:predicted nucleic acid-binding protein
MVLVDTSVWVNHFRAGDAALSALLNQGQVCMHPFVFGELALGNLRQTDAAFDALKGLPQMDAALDSEVMALIARQSLAGRGIGYVDAHLIASVFLTPGSLLWTQDQRLYEVAKSLGRDAPFGVH